MLLEFVTAHSTYMLRKDEDQYTWILGGVRGDGSLRYREWSRVRILGATWGGNFIRPDYIGKNMNLEIYDFNRNRTIITSAVRSISLIYPEPDFLAYEL
jgi:hypothetical protein